MSEPAFEDDQRFEILDKLAEGGMGVVYRARHVGLDKLVALKVLNTACNDDVAIVRFQNEAKTLSRLSHRSIAEVYDFGISKSGEPFMAIEFIEGVTLQRLLEERRRLTVDETLSMMIEISEALAHAHQRGVVHRDIKPSNIIIQQHGDSVLAKLVDFGIAKDAFSDTGDLTRTGGLIGSPLYMSPEQTLGEAITPQSDMYSLGCVIYHCLIGKPPFAGETIFDTITKHREAAIPSIRKRLPEVPEELDDLVTRLLSKEPERRYGSMTVVEKILTRILEGTVGDSQGNPIIIDTQEEEKAAEMLKATLLIDTGKDTKATSKVAIGIVFIGLVAVISAAVALSFSLKTDQTADKKIALDVSNVVATRDAERDQSIRKMLKNGNTEYESLLWTEDDDVTDDDMKVFQGSNVAEEVNFNELTIGDNALKYLADSPLLHLNLANTKVKTLKFVPASKTLTFLNLAGTHVSDEALANLSNFKRLSFLMLDATNVTAAGIRKHLKSVPLDELTLNECPNITDSDRDALANEFPMWKVVPWKKGFEGKNAIDVAEMTANMFIGQGKPQKAIEVWNLWNSFADSHTQSDPYRRLKIRVLTRLAATYDFNKNWDRAKKAADEAVSVATKYGYNREHAEAYKALFIHYLITQNFAEAAATGKTAIEWWEKGYGEADMQLSLDVGVAFMNAGKYAEAIPMLEKSLQARGNWKTALELEAEKNRSKTGKFGEHDLENIQSVRGSLSTTLLHYANCFRMLNRNREARVALDKSILVLEEIRNPTFDDLLAQCYLTLADTDIRLNNLNEALTNSKKAEALFKASRAPVARTTFVPAAIKQQEQIQALIKAHPNTASEVTPGTSTGTPAATPDRPKAVEHPLGRPD